MYMSIKTIAAGLGVAAVLAAGLDVATQASQDFTSANSSKGATAGDTMTMTADPTTLETASFTPVAKATVPCGFAATGGC
jgi:hypothetical protein